MLKSVIEVSGSLWFRYDRLYSIITLPIRVYVV